jgi:hypothetical protein
MIRDYRMTFLPIKDWRDTPQGSEQIDRRFRWEVVTQEFVTGG